MLLLGIESSCDETAAAIVTEDRKILSNVIYSQISEHEAFSGVVPEVASRAHLEKIDFVVEKAFSDAGIVPADLDAVAATCGPGLIGGVIVGATFAKAVAFSLDIPFLAINHIEAHALCVRLTENVDFPYLLLLASGGHCQICLVSDFDDFEVLGKTLDDSVGESFDKVAKMMSLGYPGGPIVEKMSRNGDPMAFDFPRPLCQKKSLDFSFSGLKTAVRITLEKLEKQKKNFDDSESLDKKNHANVCASFQRAVEDVLSYKMDAAIVLCKARNIPLNAVVISGGVAANKAIRGKMQRICYGHRLRFCAPPIPLCTDNAAMIAWNGLEKLRTQPGDPLNFQPRPRWPLGKKF
ncbi:MAG: tRNA (adenosine(37)-N6)-threonylcarbamoyltransferase complex transferase subunit TsaD [Holosporaceae bacterium]|jgi:N6-L-threonylcarbamoyladenine synthase|nr:tRNA (adenosine(37)-N6)-threonylcarbamoyltransferase complex transferase subunit TsaD [Holosporaceae bacterium]